MIKVNFYIYSLKHQRSLRNMLLRSNSSDERRGSSPDQFQVAGKEPNISNKKGQIRKYLETSIDPPNKSTSILENFIHFENAQKCLQASSMYNYKSHSLAKIGCKK